MTHDEACAQHAWFPVSWISLLSSERAVLAVAASISSFMNREGRAWPSRRAIGKRAGIKDPRAITKAIRRMQALGLMDVERRTGHSTVYVMKTRGSGSPAPLGNRNRDSLLNSDPDPLGKPCPVERSHEHYQETSRLGLSKRSNEEGVALVAALKSIGFNGDAQERADRAKHRLPGLSRLLVAWLDEAREGGMSGEEAYEWAERRSQRGERPPAKAEA